MAKFDYSKFSREQLIAIVELQSETIANLDAAASVRSATNKWLPRIKATADRIRALEGEK